jgi:polysaccharide chain length determinant protein (PEP-CTERM system associated)
MAAPDIREVIENAFDQLRGAWRFRWIALAVAAATAAVLWSVIFVIPDVYQASARVFVDTKTTLSEVTRGITLEEDVGTQIQRVRQALLGGPELQKVAEDTGLVSAGLTPMARQSALEALRTTVDISGNIQSAGVFTISYKNRTRAKALEVVDRLLNTFVEGTLGGKREGSQQAQQFLQAQISDYEKRLSAAEERLADFKKRNVGLMPGAQGDYFTRLQTETENLTKARETLGIAVRKRDELQRQLRGERPFVSGAQAPGGSGGPSSAANDTASRIREAQARLDDLLLRFTDKHPDVIALRQTLKELQDRQKAEIQAAQLGDATAAERSGLTANPVYQNIQLQFDQAQVDVAAAQQDITDREQKIATLRGFMNTAPEVEAQFAKLNRDYDVTRQQYHALLERLDRARLGEEAQATGIVRFEVIEPPTASLKPVSPKRPLLIAAGFLLALGAGGAVAFLLHFLSPVFLSVRQLSAVTGLPVLGGISMVWLDKHRAARNRSVALYLGGALALAFAAVAVLLLQSEISLAVRGWLT